MPSAALESFATALISEMESLFASISAFPHRSILSFPPESINALYVLYSPNGLPMRAGTVSSAMGSRERSRLRQEVETMAANGYVSSYRTLELESDRLVSTVAAWFSDLFGAGLPLSGVGAGASGDSNEGEGAQEKPVRRRGRGARKGAAGKRGRPRRKTVSDVEPATDQPKRRRGRPRREVVEVQEAATAPRRRGRPRKSETAATNDVAKKRRGRPRNSQAAGEIGSTPRKSGRRSTIVAAPDAAEAVTPVRRGRRAAGKGVSGRGSKGGRRGRKATAKTAT